MITLTLPMEWKNSPPIFSPATETVADLANTTFRCNVPALTHNLDDIAEAIVIYTPPTLQLALIGLTRDPYLRRFNAKISAYIDVFIDNFLGLAQAPSHRRRRVQKTLFHTLYKLFRPCDSGNLTTSKEFFLLNNLLAGD